MARDFNRKKRERDGETDNQSVRQSDYNTSTYLGHAGVVIVRLYMTGTEEVRQLFALRLGHTVQNASGAGRKGMDQLQNKFIGIWFLVGLLQHFELEIRSVVPEAKLSCSLDTQDPLRVISHFFAGCGSQLTLQSHYNHMI